MACGYGFFAEDCIIDHWTTPLRGHREQAGYRAECPHSHGERSLSYWVNGQSVCWKCYDAECERLLAYAALALIVPARCLPSDRTRRTTPARVDPDELKALALSDVADGKSMRLAMLEMAGMTTNQALDELGVRREHRSRVIAGRTRSGAKPQVDSRTRSGAG